MEHSKCVLQAWVWEDETGWRRNEAGVCSGLTKSYIGKMLAEDRCGSTRCPFFKPASLGTPGELIRHDWPNCRNTFERRLK